MNADSAFLDFPRERTDFSDQNYAILGRALSYATSFEATCRCLSSLQHIRVRVTELSNRHVKDPFALATEEIWDPFALATEEIWDKRLREHLKNILQYHEFPSDIADTLKRAKAARNQIAHEVSLGIQRGIESNSGREEIVSIISNLTFQIAEGFLIVEITSLLETHEPCPPAELLLEYPSRIVSWMIEP